MATISTVNGKKITKIKYKGEIFDTGGGSGGGDPLKEYLDEVKNANYLFCGYINYANTTWGNYLTYERLQKLLNYDTTSSVTNMISMFYYCKQLITIPLINTSLVTNMSNMFTSCSSLTTIPQLDTSNVTNMGSMFRGCSSLTIIPQLNTSKVTDMSNMFYQCTKLTTISQLNTSNVTNMGGMFRGCSSLTIIPQLNTSKVTDMSNMFYQCTKLTTISQLNTSNVTNVSYMFYYCHNLKTIDMTHMNFTSTSITSLFAYNCYSLTKLIIRNMPTIPALETNAFGNCYHFAGTTDATYNPQGLKDGRIYVPDDKVEALKTATNWSVYADIIVPLSTLQE